MLEILFYLRSVLIVLLTNIRRAFSFVFSVYRKRKLEDCDFESSIRIFAFKQSIFQKLERFIFSLLCCFIVDRCNKARVIGGV